MDHEMDPTVEELGEEGASRRRFIKKAGVVAGTAAWVVPTMQVVNMASAAAQTNGSVVSTKPPPPSTTKVPPSTTIPPKCEKFKMTAVWHCEEDNGNVAHDGDNCDNGEHRRGYWRWVEKSGPCIGGYRNYLPDGGVYFADDSDMYRVSVQHKFRGCKIIDAQTPYGTGCMPGRIVDNGYGATFYAPVADGNDNEHGLRIIEVLFECCEPEEHEQP